MRAIIDGVEIYGTPMEIMQYKEMVEAKRNNLKQTNYYIQFPAGHIPSPTDASEAFKFIGVKLNQIQGHKHYQ